ncbi:FadR/GntR family transcriptional regulator [Desulfotruncus alcoholivorax]|uniref:FadR/GntR family transcriptional regulator n=1 Tax=Desulfotruncus alcoholivorax TaxID=265477 RepID=UPI0004231000|nr:FadR/GntR family transcriptional regulator [Desulfotruncus alcoholivorax]
MELTRKKRTRLYERVVEQIQDLIKNGTLAPGDQLLPERQLAEKLEVSRSAVREALSALSQMGLIEITPGSGAYVKKADIQSLIEPLAAIMLRETRNVFHLLEARRILETGIVKVAALRASTTDLLIIRDAVNNIRQDVENSKDTDEADLDFHIAIANSTKNHILVNIMTMVSGLMREAYGPSRKKLIYKGKNIWYDQHLEIYEALVRKDPEKAAEAMERHLLTAIAELKAITEWEEYDDIEK